MDNVQESFRSLSPAQRKLFLQKLRSSRSAAKPVFDKPSIPTLRPELLPLSFGQQRLWSHHQIEGTGAAYNESGALQADGRLNFAALERSLNEIVRRHEVLRTTFQLVQGAPCQVIAPFTRFSLPIVDLRGLSTGDQTTEVNRLSTQDAHAAFDLSTGPLLRFTLLRLAEELHVFVFTVHHIVFDRWSGAIFWRELATLYHAFAQGEPSPLPDLTFQYADYALWQRHWLSGKELDRQLDYWRGQLANAPALLELPLDRPRGPFQTFHGCRHHFRLGAELSGRIRSLSQQAGATPFMTLLAAFAVLLSRYGRQVDILVGSSIANRTDSWTELLIGFFVNTLVIRNDLSGNPPFSELLQRVREAALEAYAHQDTPFEKLVEVLNPKRNPSHSPLFQVIFTLQNTPTDSLTFQGLGVSNWPVENLHAKYDLTMLMEAAAGEFIGTLEYNTDLFDQATIARMSRHFQILLESIVADPRLPVSELRLLDDGEAHQITTACNHTGADYPLDRCIHQIIEDQVDRTPDRLCVEFGQRQITYRELNEQANQVAHSLRQLSAGVETLVGICLERSLEMVFGLLGILKAGSAYLPLDPIYPPERLAFMLRDSGVKILLTQRKFTAQLEATGVQALCLDEPYPIGLERSNPVTGVTPSNPAYVIYTSGSTGKPKGVVNTHRGICNRLLWMQTEYRLTAADRVLQKTPFSFDVSVWEFFWPLMTGARLVLAKPGGHQDPEYLIDLICRRNITTLHFVPSMLRVFLEGPGIERCISLRQVFCSGEALSYRLQEHFFSQSRAELHNLYGPTEAAVDVTFWRCERGSQRPSVPIGRPIANTQIYILDGHLKSVPIGLGGELFIGGEGLARGYRNRPALTAEKFLPNPFGPPGSRLYRTGDFARFLSDGAIEYLSRLDAQVKIRGFRVEPREVELALSAHSKVNEAVVLAQLDGQGTQRLIAYIVPVAGNPPTTSELHRFMRMKVPDFMVPSAFLLVDRLPLNPNGKIDRRALRIPDVESSGAETVYELPRNETEQLVSDVWRKVLKLDNIGIYDDFFELGGESLLAITTVSRLKQIFQVELSVHRLFEGPTVAGLSECIRELQVGGHQSATKVTRRAGADTALPSFAQERLWFIDQLEGPSATYNIPAALRLRGRLNREALEWSIDAIIRRHEVLRTSYISASGQPMQVIAAKVSFVVPVHDLANVSADEQQAAIQSRIVAEAQGPFDLSKAPLLRNVLLRVAPEEHVLIFTIHHIISDAWSLGILVREFSTLYRSFVTGSETSLPDLQVQYADFAEWQREWLQGDVLETRLCYWRQQFSGTLPILALPTDHPRPPVQTFCGAAKRFEIHSDLTQKLRVLSQRSEATLFMSLLAAFLTLLHRYTGQCDIVVGCPSANRNRPEIEPLIGFFVNTLALRVDLSGNPSFQNLLVRVRAVALDAYANQDLPFEKLVEALAPDRSLTHTPLFQVMFTMQNAPIGGPDLPGLSCTLEPVEVSSAKFDLTLTLEETAAGGLAGGLEYRTELFEAGTIGRMAGHFERLLAAVVAEPHRPVARLGILGPAERAQLLEEWNATERPFPAERTLAALFEERVRQAPEAVAVVSDEETLSYRQVDGRANALAHWLQGRGVGPESLVGLPVERSARLIVAMLGIVKAGGAYVPLDPEQPAERLEGLRGRCTRVLTLEETAWASCGAGPRCLATSDNLAYVMYTSGSTGEPKGVAVTHRAVTRLVLNNDYCPLGPQDAVAQASTAAFDAATFEIWGALLNGARLVLTGRETLLSAPALRAHCSRHGISALFVTTALFNQLARAEPGAFGPLKHLLFGGEASEAGAIRRVLGSAEPPGRLIHVYGPTEVTTFATWQEVKVVEAGATGVPIGRPIGNTTLYLLDEGLEPVPIGVVGEIYLGGPGVARGYQEAPALTAAQFVPDPFSGQPGARLYRSGDLGRYRADGTVEFLGRVDEQVKVRGYRIEPAEVESVLVSHPAVQAAVVTAAVAEPADAEEAGSRKCLVGYVVSAPGGGGLDLAALRAYAAERLAPYLVPAILVELEALPLNVNGKIDRHALPKPDFSKQQAEYAAPTNWLEQRLALVWGEVLGIKNPGIHDNFFALGGHSLLATQLVSRVRNAFSAELPVRRLFEFPTISSLAECIAAIGTDLLPAPAIRPVSRDRELPLSFAQERLWFLNQLEPENPFYNMPTVLHLTGPLDLTAVGQVLNEILRRHEALRTRFMSINGNPVQVIPPSATISLVVIDLQSEENVHGAVEKLADDETRRPFDLANGPLLRASLLRLGPEQHILLLTMHHIASDGWSMGVLTREMAVLYAAFSQGLASPLPDLSIQYVDFAQWQREWLSGDVLDRQLKYWKEQLAHAPPVLNLPTDRPRPALQSFRGDSYLFDIDVDTTACLKQLSERLGATMFMTLHAAFAVLIARYGNQEDVVIGSPIANRTRAEIEPLIGFFVNTLALRTDLSGDPSFIEVVSQVRRRSLDAYAHQDLPFERLVDELQPERDLSRNPIFQVMFALQNAPLESYDVPNLKMEIVPRRRISAQFDVVLDVWETERELRGVLEYNTDLFDPSTIERMASHFKTLLAGVAADADQRVSQLPLLTEFDRTLLLSVFNDTAFEFPHDKPLHQLFAEKVASSPQGVCCIHNGCCLTYAELDANSNQIAQLLRRTGIGCNSFVGILDERGHGFLAAILGILKAGAAFVPIDPSYPQNRVHYMIDDSQLAVLITRWDLWEKFQLGTVSKHLRAAISIAADSKGRPLTNGTVQFYDADDVAAQEAYGPANINESSDLAYLIYTSGSTGLPKGAMIRHIGAVNHIFAEFRELQFHPGTAFLQSAPSSSDISVWQFLAPLLIGGCTVIADFETVCDPVKLFTLIKTERVTLIELVPVLLKQLLDHVAGLLPADRALPDLEWVMVTGEAVPVPLVNDWFALYPSIRLVNAYGPTEAADDVCQYVLRGPLRSDALVVPIGKPVGNLALYVLDSHLNLVPVGVLGEICVSGVGVGAGYWRNPEQTRESFRANPYEGELRGPVIYRTGDLGRWLPDGNIEMLGRLDQQVKLRGFRIELGEIESIIGQHPAVRESVVLIREDGQAEKRLVAYVTPEANSGALKAETLREEQVSLWRDLHEESYLDSLDYGDPTFDVIGWDSSYTGQPLPRAEMEEYVTHTTERVLALNPRAVLEIGCGTGLLLFRIAPYCERYAGTDLSPLAIRRLTRVAERLQNLEHVELFAKCADEFDGFEPGSFDLVLLSSVVQYFPGIEYLMRVLEGALHVLGPKGVIFLGDVRSLPLLKAFHASVQFSKATDRLTPSRLRQRIRQQLAHEQEMAVDPALFLVLRERWPQITHVSIKPKRGLHHNELTRFRYDVTLHVGGETEEVDQVAWLEWNAEQWPLERIRRHLVEAQPEIFGIRSIRNRRLEREVAMLEWINLASDSETVGTFRERLERREARGIDPEELLGAGTELGYDVHTHCSIERSDGGFDAVFERSDARSKIGRSRWVAGLLSKPENIHPWAAYANDPLHEKLTRELVPRVRNFLKEKLPGYMVPPDFVVLPALPLLPNGKIDREALPLLDVPAAGVKDFAPPKTPVEKALAGIWAEILGLQQIGIRDNFFELGGHSLKATQVVSRIQKELGVEVPLREIFRMPTIEELAGEVESKNACRYAAIPKIPEAYDYPMSNAQQRVWVLSQTEEGSVAYNMPGSLLLEGAIDQDIFAKAFDVLLTRHESLRTSFAVNEAGEPRQRVHPIANARLQPVDLSTDENPEVRAQELAAEDAIRPFDLEHGPLVRMSLLKLTESRFVLLFNMHHVISDDWSIGVLVREFGRVYGSLRQRVPASLPPLRIQYRDYAAWQNHLLESEAADIHRQYWLEKLAGEIPTINLPTDFPRPTLKTYRGNTRVLKISQAQTDSLLNLSANSGTTLFMTFVAVVKILLHRYTGDKDICIGFPIAGRNHADLEDQIGFYVNTLTLRDQIDAQMPFMTVLRKVQKRATEAYEHQFYPFDRLVNELALPRDVSRSPLFDVLVVEQNIDPYEFAIDGVKVKPFVTQFAVSKFDLSFSVTKGPRHLDVAIVYNPDLFLESRIERMSQHLRELLSSVLADPYQPIARLNILSESERRRLLDNSNPAPADYSREETLVGWFEEQSARTPSAVAVTCETQHLTYRELNAKANQLAHYLRSLGIRANVPVGICAERSLELVVGLLGILKAGGAYVPLDPVHPSERLSLMLEDSQAPVLLAQESVAANLPPHGARTVRLDADWPVIETGAGKNPPAELRPDDAAYVMYTSGSTGKPKGVVVSHANVVRLFTATDKWFHFGETDVWSLFHSYAFDFSVWEIWGALLYGGRLVVVPHWVSRSPDAFHELLCAEGITVLNQTPSAFRQLIQANLAAGEFSRLRLRTVIFGGEPLEIRSLLPWFVRHGDDTPRIVNMYGITETTVHVTYRVITAADVEAAGSVIGCPIPDLRVYLLDEYLEPVPIGIPGEICVGGPGVAGGYLHRPELTAERFLADPFQRNRPGARLYRSGDLARYLPNGELEYLGRIDHQVKIRGFRIEPGDIEAAFASHPQVAETVVVLREDYPGDKRLVAYVVLKSGESAVSLEIRQFVRTKLPDYMVPARILILPKFPLTPHGKIDRRALPVPEEASLDAHEITHTAPGNETECMIAGIWKEVLKSDQIGIDDNFFDLGGDSILIIQTQRRIRQSTNRDISILEMFRTSDDPRAF